MNIKHQIKDALKDLKCLVWLMMRSPRTEGTYYKENFYGADIVNEK